MSCPESPSKKARISEKDDAVFSSLEVGQRTTPLSLVPPGKCQFTSTFASVPLLERGKVSDTTSVLRFALPDGNGPLNLSTCACILARSELPTEGGKDEEKKMEEVVRPYTPISTNELVGSFDLLIKHYDNGTMSKHMRDMSIGDKIDFKHIDFNVKIQAPFPQKQIGMIVGGTGITPMIQALHAILQNSNSDNDDEKTEVNILYGSRVSTDILGKDMLTQWEKHHGDQLKVTHVLSNEPEDSEWKGKRGFINAELIQTHLPSPSLGKDAIVFICGPPPMYDALCGPRQDSKVSGVLGDLGYDESQVYKF